MDGGFIGVNVFVRVTFGYGYVYMLEVLGGDNVSIVFGLGLIEMFGDYSGVMYVLGVGEMLLEFS